MKKRFPALVLIICLAVSMSLAATGCSSGDSGPASGSKVDTSSIDVDLTILSSTMVYSEVSDMMTQPGNYKGKSVKMTGIFAVYHDDSTGNDYYACVIQDATACCQQGIEFTLAGDKNYPDDYPKIGSEITVAGVFDTYEEGGYTYCTLRDAVLI